MQLTKEQEGVGRLRDELELPEREKRPLLATMTRSP